MIEEIYRGHTIQIGAKSAEFSSAPAFELLSLSAPDPAPDTLYINAEVVPYYHTDMGFSIYYTPPEPTLIEAVHSFLNTQREAGQ